VAVTFLRRRRNELTEAFWADLEADDEDVPVPLQELARRDTQVVVDRVDAEAALEWARRHPMWREDRPAVVIVDT
jgi:hypothetical protein